MRHPGESRIQANETVQRLDTGFHRYDEHFVASAHARKSSSRRRPQVVIPAKAGIQAKKGRSYWIPVFTGMTRTLDSCFSGARDFLAVERLLWIANFQTSPSTLMWLR
jgi:hypothetical protein